MDSKRSLMPHEPHTRIYADLLPSIFVLSNSYYDCYVFLLLLPISMVWIGPIEVPECELQATWGLPPLLISFRTDPRIDFRCRIEDTRNLKDEIVKSCCPERCSMHLGTRRQCRHVPTVYQPWSTLSSQHPQCCDIARRTCTSQTHTYQNASYDAFRICSLGRSGW